MHLAAALLCGKLSSLDAAAHEDMRGAVSLFAVRSCEGNCMRSC